MNNIVKFPNRTTKQINIKSALELTNKLKNNNASFAISYLEHAMDLLQKKYREKIAQLKYYKIQITKLRVTLDMLYSIDVRYDFPTLSPEQVWQGIHHLESLDNYYNLLTLHIWLVEDCSNEDVKALDKHERIFRVLMDGKDQFENIESKKKEHVIKICKQIIMKDILTYYIGLKND